MQTLAGPSSKVYFTHVSSLSKTSLENLFASSLDKATLPANESKAKVLAFTQGVLEVMKTENVPLEKVCLLDPKAPQELSPEDGDGRFEWFLFGVS